MTTATAAEVLTAAVLELRRDHAASGGDLQARLRAGHPTAGELAKERIALLAEHDRLAEAATIARCDEAVRRFLEAADAIGEAWSELLANVALSSSYPLSLLRDMSALARELWRVWPDAAASAERMAGEL